MTAEGRGYGKRVAIPILQNSRVVNQGDELLVFEEKTAQEKRPATIEPLPHPKKKRR